MKVRTATVVMSATMALGWLSSAATAQVAEQVGFQALIRDNLGERVNGLVDLEFRLYSTETGGVQVDMNGDGVVDALDTVSRSGVQAADGILTTKFPVAAAAFDGASKWLEVSVEGVPLSRIEFVTPTATATQLNVGLTGKPVVSVDPQTEAVNVVSELIVKPAEPVAAGSVAGVVRPPKLILDDAEGTATLSAETTESAGAAQSGVIEGVTLDAEGNLEVFGPTPTLAVRAERLELEPALVFDGTAAARSGAGGKWEWDVVTGTQQFGAALLSADETSGKWAINAPVDVGATEVLQVGGEVKILDRLTLESEVATAEGESASALVRAWQWDAASGTQTYGAATLSMDADTGGAAFSGDLVVQGAQGIQASRVDIAPVAAMGTSSASGVTPTASIEIDPDTGNIEVIVGGERVMNLTPPIESTVSGIAPNVLLGALSNSISPVIIGNTVGGGRFNSSVGTVEGQDFQTIAGGEGNTTSRQWATIGGGLDNTASGGASTVAGGEDNIASGVWAAVPGGFANTAGGNYSFAAGRSAKALHSGAFVWADSTGFGFSSTASNQFLVRAAGGVGIGTNSPGSPLEVQNPSTASSAKAVHGIMTSTSPGSFSAAVRGENRGTGGLGIGVYGSQNGTGWGVAGQAESGGCDFAAIGGGTDYCSFSSVRWKRDIRDIDGAIEKVMQLRGVYFDWDTEHGGHHDVGMIAEEVGKVLPEIVNYEENGVDANGMDYSKLSPLLVEAVKALHADQNARFAAQENEIEALRQRIEALERPASRGSLTRAGLPLVFLGLIGVAALCRRSANGGGR